MSHGTCQSHADIHTFSDECVGWRDYPASKYYFHSDEPAFLEWLESAVSRAQGSRIRFLTRPDGTLSVKVREGTWIDFDGTPDSYRDNS